MERHDIASKIYSKIDELPTLPIVVPKLLRLVEDPKSNLSDLTQLISNDPALTAKILKIANSAYYGFSQQVSELNRAVSLIGFKMVRTLAVSIGIFNALPSVQEDALFTREGLWQHSIATAVIMNELKKVLLKDKEGDYLFVIGLLHDIGKIVLDHFFHEEFREVIIKSNEANKNLHDVENDFIGIDHTEIAAILLERWKFPEIISTPIAFLHTHEVPGEINKRDIALLRIANSLAQELELSKEGNINANIIHREDMETLDITEDEIEQLRKKIQTKKEEIESLYKAIIET